MFAAAQQPPPPQAVVPQQQLSTLLLHVQQNNVRGVEEVVKALTRLNLRPEQIFGAASHGVGVTPLLQAAHYGAVDVLEYMFDGKVMDKDAGQRLFEARPWGHPLWISALLGPVVDDIRHDPARLAAVRARQVRTVECVIKISEERRYRLFLRESDRTPARSHESVPALIMAVRNDDAAMLTFLKGKKFRLDSMNHGGESALHEAIRGYHWNAFDWLCENLDEATRRPDERLDINCEDRLQQTALYLAADRSLPRIVRVLFAKGASNDVEASSEPRLASQIAAKRLIERVGPVDQQPNMLHGAVLVFKHFLHKFRDDDLFLYKRSKDAAVKAWIKRLRSTA